MTVGKLTDREKWEWYIKLGLERAKQMKDASEGKTRGKTFAPETEEESLFALSLLGIAVPPDKRGKNNGSKSGS